MVKVTYLNKLFTGRNRLEVLGHFPDIVRQVELDTPAIRFGVSLVRPVIHEQYEHNKAFLLTIC